MLAIKVADKFADKFADILLDDSNDHEKTRTESNSKPQPESSPVEEESGPIKNKRLLHDGTIFLKYGSWGEPGERLISLSKDLKFLEWRHLDQDLPSGCLAVDNLIGIKFGRTTGKFKRRPATKPEQEQLSFSIIGEKRNLDLEARSKEEMDAFVEGFVSLMKYVKKLEKKMSKTGEMQ